MFGLQAPKLKQLLRALPSGIGDSLAGVIGDCDAELEHNGPVELNGPLTLGDKVYSTKGNNDGSAIDENGDGSSLLIDALKKISYLNLSDSVITDLIRRIMPRIVSLYTLAADLNADATVVVGEITYSGAMIRDTYKLVSGTTVLAINGGNNTYYIIAADACEVPQ